MDDRIPIALTIGPGSRIAGLEDPPRHEGPAGLARTFDDVEAPLEAYLGHERRVVGGDGVHEAIDDGEDGRFFGRGRRLPWRNGRGREEAEHGGERQGGD